MRQIKLLYLFLIILFISLIKTYYNIEHYTFSILSSNKEYDIYLFPSSMFTNKIYDFRSILEKKGNIIDINYPSNTFDLDKFATDIYDKIKNKKKKCILVGYSFGALMSNIVNSKFKNNSLLKKVLLISNSCSGNVTDKAMNIYKDMSNVKSEKEQLNLIYKLLFPEDFSITDVIKNKIKNNQLSSQIQQSIGSAIGSWIVKNEKICSLDNKVKTIIIHGDKDIVYPIGNNPEITKVKNAGHGIIFQDLEIINNWIEKSLK